MPRKIFELAKELDLKPPDLVEGLKAKGRGTQAAQKQLVDTFMWQCYCVPLVLSRCLLHVFCDCLQETWEMLVCVAPQADFASMMYHYL